MSSSPWTLKVELNGEVRRLRDFACDAEQITIEAVQDALKRVFDLGNEEVKAVTLKYKDDDGDLCTLCSVTLPDAVALALESRTLRIFGSRPPAPQPPAAEPAGDVAPPGGSGSASNKPDGAAGDAASSTSAPTGVDRFLGGLQAGLGRMWGQRAQPASEEAAPGAASDNASLPDLIGTRVDQLRCCVAERLSERVEEVRTSRRFQAGSERVMEAIQTDQERLVHLREHVEAAAGRVSGEVETMRATHGNAVAGVGVAAAAALAVPVACVAVSAAQVAIGLRVAAVAGGAIVAAAGADSNPDDTSTPTEAATPSGDESGAMAQAGSS